jgi:hypothetical protein
MLFSTFEEKMECECWARDSDGSTVMFLLQTLRQEAAMPGARRHLRRTWDIRNEHVFNEQFLPRCAAQERMFGVCGIYNGVRLRSSLPILCEQRGLGVEYGDPDERFTECVIEADKRAQTRNLTTNDGVSFTTYLHPVFTFHLKNHEGWISGYWLDNPVIVLYKEPAQEMAFMFLEPHFSSHLYLGSVIRTRSLGEDAVVIAHLYMLGDGSIADAVWNHLTVKLIQSDGDCEEPLYVWSGEALAPHQVLADKQDLLYSGSGGIVLAFQGRDVCEHGYDPTTLDATTASAADFRDYVRVFPKNTTIVFDLDESFMGLVEVNVSTFGPAFVCASALIGSAVTVCPHPDIKSAPGSCV